MSQSAGVELSAGQQLFLAEMRAALAGTKAGVQIKGAEVRQIKAGSSSKIAGSSIGSLRGFSLRETTGASPATVYFRDGSGTDGDIIAVVQLGPGESTRDFFGDGLAYEYGVYLDLASGLVEGAVYLNGSAG